VVDFLIFDACVLRLLTRDSSRLISLPSSVPSLPAFPFPPGRSGIDLENSIAFFPEFAARPGVLFFLLCRRRQMGKSKQSLRF